MAQYYGGMINAMGGGLGNAGAVAGAGVLPTGNVANLFRERMQQGGMIPGMGATPGGVMGRDIGNLAGISFDINESPKNRKMRGVRKLAETGVGGEKDAAIEILKKTAGPQLPLAMGNPLYQMGNMAAMYGANV
jgi:hypothetical protein